MVFVAVLNALGLLLWPILPRPKYENTNINLKDFYPEFNSIITPKPLPETSSEQTKEPESTQKESEESYNVHKPSPTPTSTPIPTPSPTPTPKITNKPKENENIRDNINTVAAKFIEEYEKNKNYKENIQNYLRKIFNKVPDNYKLILSKLKFIDYPIEYSVINALPQISYYETSNNVINILLSKQTIVSKIVFVPSENTCYSAKSLTVTLVSDRESMSYRIDLNKNIAELQTFEFNLPLLCTRIIFSDIKTDGNTSKSTIPYFGLFGPELLN